MGGDAAAEALDHGLPLRLGHGQHVCGPFDHRVEMGEREVVVVPGQAQHHCGNARIVSVEGGQPSDVAVVGDDDQVGP